MAVTLQNVLELAEVVNGVRNGSKVVLLQDDGSLREAHLRRFGGSRSDVETTTVDLSDWHTEWTVPLMELAALRAKGEMAFKD